jgi:hypothetical protein
MRDDKLPGDQSWRSLKVKLHTRNDQFIFIW